MMLTDIGDRHAVKLQGIERSGDFFMEIRIGRELFGKYSKGGDVILSSESNRFLSRAAEIERNLHTSEGKTFDTEAKLAEIERLKDLAIQHVLYPLAFFPATHRFAFFEIDDARPSRENDSSSDKFSFLACIVDMTFVASVHGHAQSSYEPYSIICKTTADVGCVTPTTKRALAIFADTEGNARLHGLSGKAKSVLFQSRMLKRAYGYPFVPYVCIGSSEFRQWFNSELVSRLEETGLYKNVVAELAKKPVCTKSDWNMRD